MLRSEETLTELIVHRLDAAGPLAQQCLDQASEVIVFGSMAVGLDRLDSDIDVLCIGGYRTKIKSDLLDMIGLTMEASNATEWLHSELASHIGQYGIWIKGPSLWKKNVRIHKSTIEAKRRRIATFMRYLPDSWCQLEEVYRTKYSIKLRRETQRLLLLERGVPVPPTAVLDKYWQNIFTPSSEIRDRLCELTGDGKSSFSRDLLGRIERHFMPASVQAYPTFEVGSVPHHRSGKRSVRA